jgi:hypothetical protein
MKILVETKPTPLSLELWPVVWIEYIPYLIGEAPTKSGGVD